MPLEPSAPAVVNATTISGGTVLVLDFSVPMVQDTPVNGNGMLWNVAPVGWQSCTGASQIYVWNSPTQVAITANGALTGAKANTCTWSPDVGTMQRLRSVQGAFLQAFANFPLT